MAVPEIKLDKVAIQVRFADVLVHAINATLQDREKALNGIGGDNASVFAAHIFVFAVIDGPMPSEVPADFAERRRFVGHEVAFGRSKVFQRRAEIVGANVRHVDGSRGTIPLDQRENRVHVAAAARMGLLHRLAANVGHVRLNSLALTAERRVVVLRLHGLADPMGEEPSGLHAAIKGPLDLPSADALLAARDKLDGLKPQVQREVTILKNATDPHGEGLAAGVALPQAGATGLAGQATDPLPVAIATVRANRPFRPKVGLDIGKSRFLIVKMGGATWA
jgi:hypothetical protein